MSTAARPDRLFLWTVLAAGPVLWTVHVVLGYALVEVACSPSATSLDVLGLHVETVIHLSTVLISLALVGAGAMSYRSWIRTRNGTLPDGTIDPYRWLALAALFSSIIFLMLTVLEGLGPFVFAPCEPAL